ncbi:alpha-2-macroglobulin family protein [Phyllobacterium sp. 0TCS1.6C]|uniref:alpha-2-macroglobulin family protein n=1 Tax=unclassified Phyllobacterium TaxID=2638441 RepID=UPI002263FE7B|nr:MULTISPECIES: alpha-2-macroglobulin family protein [unclassified Phyllobacterium]MCX8281156.1 alpha-2-macroglobulin family protein [Phyllobacterium sp. 0TCS1.6C]MCX8294557.1 alpha-2-macroglobulin family protein [Phyllobacterium sp. 0TCS1.6A]
MRSAIRFAAVILGYLALSGPIGAAEINRDIVTTKDGDYFGFDLRTEEDLTLDQCETVCLADQQCKAFTYNPKAKWCFLKSDFSQLRQTPGSFAGKVVETTVGEPDIGAPPQLAFVSDAMLRDARQVKANLAVTREQEAIGLAGLLAAARREFNVDNPQPALQAMIGALAIAPDNADLWLEMAQMGNRAGKNSYMAGQAALAAINAYQLTRTAEARAGALAVMAEALENSANYRAALNAYKASLALVDSGPVKVAYEDLKGRQGFRVTNHTIDADSANPRACVQFSEPLVKMGTDYAPFVTVNGAAPRAMEAKGNEICVEGLQHGERYKLALRAGLPSSVGEALEGQVDLEIYVKDRSSMVRFTGDSFVLPSTARRGIPIVSVNTQSADLKLYRIGDRGIAPLLTSSQFLTQVDGYSAQRLQDEAGELVWQGKIDIQSELNKDVVTSFPVDEALPQRKPGVYVLTASAPEAKTEEWDAKATQWFVVSDIGLSTYTGTDGLNVFARSLASAQPLIGVELQLLAKNNEILGTAITDTEGRATFNAGLLRGSAAMVPAAITAKNGDADYVFLDMTRAGFDLSDRGVTGRAAPGAIDILAWTERGIYRAGETVHASALARDNAANAIEKLPLTFVFKRPDGVEDRRMVSDGANLGGHALALALQPNAMRGTWTMQIFTDPKGTAIAEKQFLVEDFVPDRVEFDLASEAKAVEVGQATPVTVTGRYLYGAPAAGLALEGEIALKPTRENPAFKGYFFGLADEEASEDTRIPLDTLQDLDEQGRSTFDVSLAEVPSTTQFLDANVVIRMQEAGGRAVERTLTLPVKPETSMIGIRPEFSGDLSENSVAKFNVIGIDAAGAKQEMKGLSWKLISLERRYQWYRDGSSWKYEPVVSTKQVANGSIDVSADGAEISVPVGWGRFRLEVETSQADGPASSVEFDAGYYVAATSTETPDGLEIALDKEVYAPGDTAKLKVSSRFAGELLVTVGAETLLATTRATIGAEGGEVELPVSGDWGAGAYVTATLFRPGDAQESRMPMRAIGIKWLSINAGDRKLNVALDAPQKTEPRKPLDVALQVTGAGAGEDAYVTLAAVDVGILNLTRYEAPDPDGWYFGQRQLGMEIRDLYGRLIDGSQGATGKLRTGGDGAQMPMQGNPPTEKLIAFFSGPVKLDAEGKARVSFDVPQFNGTARLMAVAWSKTGVGHAVKDVVVRDPIVVTASVPKFLAPKDQASVRFDIANTDAPAGDYQLQIAGNAAVSVDQASSSRTVNLPVGGKADVVLPISGNIPGDGVVSVKLTNASGLSLEQTLNIPVRPATLPMAERKLITIAPNTALKLDGELLAGSILQGASVSLNVTRSVAFDIPGLLMTLDRYPYGCAEQMTSRALPLLYMSELAKKSGIAEDGEVQKRVQEAIYRVLAYQSSSGSFGLWRPGTGDLWLDAYVTDFLTRAREQKYDVPEASLVQALENLQNALGYDVNIKDQGNEIAYALYVLARNRKAAISDLRYYTDTKLAEFPTPLARAHLAAALSLYGDVQRAQSIFTDALQQSSLVQNVSLVRSDYGSSLRDDAAVLALAAESRPVPPIIPQLSRIVAEKWQAKRYTSTQEQTWMLLAARAIQEGDDTIRLDVNGTAHSGGYVSRVSGDELLASPVTVTNTTAEPLSAIVTSVASPVQPLPAGGDGFTIQRTYYTLDGQEANVTEARQNERYVVVIKVTENNQWPSRVLVSDLLPAGFEIDNPGLVNSANLSNFDWIGEVQAAHTEFRNDRFVAAFDRVAKDNDDITLAYVVRAVTPGRYSHPAASVEDMYRPQFSARTATGFMEVTAAR